ncbi:MAG: hypothetical protein KKA41_10210 [Proteobacteria bacterium]|nr:hypothetical protein [Pseudomonadota bacterium]
MQMRRPSLWFGCFFTALSLITLALIIFDTHRLPIFGHFEIITQIIFLVGLSGLQGQRIFQQLHPGLISPVMTGSWMLSLLLLILLYFFPKTVNPDFYMYGHASVQVFFNFRICAGSFFLIGALNICVSPLKNAPIHALYTARNFLLIGAICFLISECAGSFWCLNWYGDSWHWSKGFLKASCVFMGLMLAFHVPGNWKWPKALHMFMGCLPGLGILWLLFMH